MIHEEQIPDPIDLEHNVLEQLIATNLASGLGCPDCGGSLWQIDNGSVKRYQCHVGHAFVAESLLKSQGGEIERHLWSGLRLLREQAIVARQLAAEARSQNRPAKEIEQLEAQVEQAQHQAELLRQVLLTGLTQGTLERMGA